MMLCAWSIIFSLGFGCGYYYLDARRTDAAIAIEDKSGDCSALFEKKAVSPAAETQAAGNAPDKVLSDPAAAEKLFAASKNSTLYHTPDCQYVKRIREENRVWFGSAAEAQAAGKKPHSCIAGDL